MNSESCAPTAQPEQPHNYWHLPGETPVLYERFGVDTFKKWMPSTGDYMRHKFAIEAGGLEPQLSMQDNLEKLVHTTKVVELAHYALTAAIGAEELIMYMPGEPVKNVIMGTYFGVTQLLVNAYPIMVQRYNRLRAYKALGVLAQRNVSKQT